MVRQKVRKVDSSLREKSSESASKEVSRPQEDETTATAEQRLAALGEAFLNSIDGTPILPRIERKKAARVSAISTSRPSTQKAQTTSADVSESKKRKKQKKKRAGSIPELPRPSPLLAPKDAKSIANSTPNQEVAASSGRAQAKPLQVPGRPTPVSERRRFMSDKICQIRSEAQPPEVGRRKRGDPEEDAFFKKTLKEVLNFVTPQLGKTERLQFERKRILALGGTLEKRACHNYAYHQRKRKDQEEERQKKLQEEKILGVSFSETKHRHTHIGDSLVRKKKKEGLQKKRRRDNEILNLGMGAKESRGLAIIPKRSIKAFHQS